MNHLFRKTGIYILAGAMAGTGLWADHAQAATAAQTETAVQTEGQGTLSVTGTDIEQTEIAVGEYQRVTIKTAGDMPDAGTAYVQVYSKNRDVSEKYSVSKISGNTLIFDIPTDIEDADDDFVVTKLVIGDDGAAAINLGDGGDALAYTVSPTGSEGTPAKTPVSLFDASEEKLAGKNANDGKFVIVLDPGHDPICNERAPVNGVWETEMNWIIADAMKKELEKYDVEVYINRYWDECPGQEDLGNMGRCVNARAFRGNDLDADLFVSLHNNASGSGSIQHTAKGSTVYVTQYGAYYDQSVVLANMVMDKLAELGISKRGVETRDWGTGAGTYDDGTRWDYYGVIRESSKNHIPSILIEHAFMDNPTDLEFLRDRETLVKMGQKDAEAIVEYYELEEAGSDTEGGEGEEGGQDEQTVQVEDFVRRLYELVLGREADEEGLEAWTKQLIGKNNTGAEAAYGFIFSEEFKEKNLSDSDYVDILYRTCLNRNADEAGSKAWTDILKVPFSREYVLRGFIESEEFTEICGSYDIERGSIKLTEARDQNDGVTRFIARCYNIFLDREADVEGLNAWAKVVLKDREEARNVPYGFVFSEEMNEKNLSDEDFVRLLYRGIFDREPDKQGVSAWVDVIESGESREHVLEGFVQSAEFTKLLSDYGL